jgi:hypothetical protein
MAERVFDEDDATKDRGNRHGDVQNDGRSTLSPTAPSREGLKVHAQGIDGEECAGASQQLVDVSSELTVKDYVEGSVCVSGHHESHDCYEGFDCGPRRVRESLKPTKLGSRQRKSKEGAADDCDYYVSFVDPVVHGAPSQIWFVYRVSRRMNRASDFGYRMTALYA